MPVVREQPSQQALVHASGGGERAVLVEREPSAAQFVHRGVDQRVARAGVEGHGVRLRGYDGDVGDPPDVQGGRHSGAAAQQHEVDQADQRCALPAGRDVARAEAGDDRVAGGLGDPGRFAELERAVDLPVRDPVVHGLPV